MGSTDSRSSGFVTTTNPGLASDAYKIQPSLIRTTSIAAPRTPRLRVTFPNSVSEERSFPCLASRRCSQLCACQCDDRIAGDIDVLATRDSFHQIRRHVPK